MDKHHRRASIQQRHPVSNDDAQYSKTSVSATSPPSKENRRLSDRVASAAEHLLKLASAQTPFPEPSCSADCHRSNSRDSGLGKDSDSGSSSGQMPASQPSDLAFGTNKLARDCQYVEDSRSSRHPYSQSLSRPQPVCTVLPQMNYGKNYGYVEYPPYDAVVSHNRQQEAAYRCFDGCDLLNDRSPRMAHQTTTHLEFVDFAYAGSKHQSRERFRVAPVVACHRTGVRPVRCSASRRSEMPSAQEFSSCRDSVTMMQPARYSSAGASGCGRVVDYMPAGDSAFASEHRARPSMSGCGGKRHKSGRPFPLEQRNEVVYNNCRTQTMSCQSSVNPLLENASLVRYQQRYQPYSSSQRNCSGADLHGISRHPFRQPSHHGLLQQFRQNDDLFYDLHTSGTC